MRSSWFLKKIGACAITEFTVCFCLTLQLLPKMPRGMSREKKCQHVLLSSLVLKVFSKFRVLLWPGPGAPEQERLGY